MAERRLKIGDLRRPPVDPPEPVPVPRSGKLVPPPRAVIGWYLKFDDDVRRQRFEDGLWCPELTQEDLDYIAEAW